MKDSYDDSDDEDDLFQRYYEGGKGDRIKEKYGDQVNEFNVGRDSNLTGGLAENRGCTDMICLIIFTAFTCSLVFATYWGFTNGNTHRITASISGDNLLCGAPDFLSKTHLYFTKIGPSDVTGLFDRGVCVDKCPSGVTEGTKLSAYTECTPTAAVPDCANAVAHNTVEVLTYCLPDVTEMSDNTAVKWEAAWENFLDTAAGSSF